MDQKLAKLFFKGLAVQVKIYKFPGLQHLVTAAGELLFFYKHGL